MSSSSLTNADPVVVGDGGNHLLSAGVVYAFTRVSVDDVSCYLVLARSSAIHSSQSVQCMYFCGCVTLLTWIFTACSELRKVLFWALSVAFLFVSEISREPLNRFSPYSRGRRVWSPAQKSLNVKVKGQGHQGQKTGFLADIS